MIQLRNNLYSKYVSALLFSTVTEVTREGEAAAARSGGPQQGGAEGGGATAPRDRRTGGPPEGRPALSFLLSQVGFESSRRFQQSLEKLELERPHFALLNYLDDHEGLSQQALGDALHIPPSRMVGLLDELEARKLAERRVSPADRRANAVHLSERGRTLLAEARKIAIAHEQMVSSCLTPAERTSLISLLGRVGRALGLTAGVHPGLQPADPPPAPWSEE